MRVSASALWVPVLSVVFGTVSVVGGILIALGGSLPISPYVTTISFAIYVICRIVGNRRMRARLGATTPAPPTNQDGRRRGTGRREPAERPDHARRNRRGPAVLTGPTSVSSCRDRSSTGPPGGIRGHGAGSLEPKPGVRIEDVAVLGRRSAWRARRNPADGWIRASARITSRPPSGVWPCTKESAPSSSTRSMVTGTPLSDSVMFSGRTPKVTSLRPFAEASASSSRGSGKTCHRAWRPPRPTARSAGSSRASP